MNTNKCGDLTFLNVNQKQFILQDKKLIRNPTRHKQALCDLQRKKINHEANLNELRDAIPVRPTHSKPSSIACT